MVKLRMKILWHTTMAAIQTREATRSGEETVAATLEVEIAEEIAADLTAEVEEDAVAEEDILIEVAADIQIIKAALIEVDLRIAAVVTKVMEHNQTMSPTEVKAMAIRIRTPTATKKTIIKATLQGAEAANVAASSSEEDHGWAEMPLTVTIINLFIA
jgi:hypothetical protein